jgi:hypothetical protein
MFIIVGKSHSVVLESEPRLDCFFSMLVVGLVEFTVLVLPLRCSACRVLCAVAPSCSPDFGVWIDLGCIAASRVGVSATLSERFMRVWARLKT